MAVDIHDHPQYRLWIRVDHKVVHDERLVDPFVTSETLIRGWRAAWRCLWDGLVVGFRVDGSREAVRVVFQGDYTLDPQPSVLADQSEGEGLSRLGAAIKKARGGEPSVKLQGFS